MFHCVFFHPDICILHWQSVGDHQIRCGSVVFHVVLHSSNFCSPLHMTENAHCFTSFLIRSIHIDIFYFFYSNLDCHSRRAVAFDSRFIFYVIWHTSVFSLCFSSIFSPKFDIAHCKCNTLLRSVCSDTDFVFHCLFKCTDVFFFIFLCFLLHFFVYFCVPFSVSSFLSSVKTISSELLR